MLAELMASEPVSCSNFLSKSKQRNSVGLEDRDFTGLPIEKDIKEYVSHCKRCILGKRHRTRKLEHHSWSVKNDCSLRVGVQLTFWTAEDSHNKSIDGTCDNRPFHTALLCVSLPKSVCKDSCSYAVGIIFSAYMASKASTF
ncbi:hypothetical protein NFI96_016270 [Prochilodus magdalenae]|nr:hypothetical protein NFI96_016270 [Prochilodus magdalenae]